MILQASQESYPRFEY